LIRQFLEHGHLVTVAVSEPHDLLIREAFPDVDTNNLPAEFAQFVRVAAPVVGVYENYTGVTYELVDGVYTDIHHVVAMTAQEIAAKQQATRDAWAASNGFASWVLDETTCSFEPPTPRPTDGRYRWDEPTTSWIEIVT
jgi:hypothetical protein